MPSGGMGVNIGVWGWFLCPLSPPKKKKASPLGVVGAESASAPSPRVA